MPRVRHLPLPLVAAFLVVTGVAWVAVSPFVHTTAASVAVFEENVAVDSDLQPAVSRIDRLFQDRWTRDRLAPAEAADELLVFRRLSLALLGTAPALEEVRAFRADDAPDRPNRWTERWLRDRR